MLFRCFTSGQHCPWRGLHNVKLTCLSYDSSGLGSPTFCLLCAPRQNRAIFRHLIIFIGQRIRRFTKYYRIQSNPQRSRIQGGIPKATLPLAACRTSLSPAALQLSDRVFYLVIHVSPNHLCSAIAVLATTRQWALRTPQKMAASSKRPTMLCISV